MRFVAAPQHLQQEPPLFHLTSPLENALLKFHSTLPHVHFKQCGPSSKPDKHVVLLRRGADAVSYFATLWSAPGLSISTQQSLQANQHVLSSGLRALLLGWILARPKWPLVSGCTFPDLQLPKPSCLQVPCNFYIRLHNPQDWIWLMGRCLAPHGSLPLRNFEASRLVGSFTFVLC